MNSSFDKTALRFPIQESCVYLNHCGVSPLYPGAARAGQGLGSLRNWGTLR